MLGCKRKRLSLIDSVEIFDLGPLQYLGFYTPEVKSYPEPIWKRNKVSIFRTARDRTTADLSDTYAPPAEHIPPLSLAQAR